MGRPTAASSLSAGEERRAPGTVASHQKISNEEGNFPETLDADLYFGRAVAALGDVDGDGIGDIAVGAPGEDDGGLDSGALWVLFLRSDGSVRANQKIGPQHGGFGGDVGASDSFGMALVSPGDVDGDGTPDLAVGAAGDRGFRGAVWLLFLAPDGTVRAQQEIRDGHGGFSGHLQALDGFGGSVAALGDLDGDGVPDLAVGASGDDDGGRDRGAVFVLSLARDGSVRAQQKISSLRGGFTGVLHDLDDFGWAVAGVGDLDGDGRSELAVGAWEDDENGLLQGAVWVLFLEANGHVRAQQKIDDDEGGFTGGLDFQERFGFSLAALGDLDGDGVGDLAVGSNGNNHGNLWILFLLADGTVRAQQEIHSGLGGFTGAASNLFGSAVAGLGDLDGDGTPDLAVGEDLDSAGHRECGSAWILFLNSNGTVAADAKITDAQPGFEDTLNHGDGFGGALAALGDLDGDGIGDFAVGAAGDDGSFGSGVVNRGAVWVLFLQANGTVRAHAKLGGPQSRSDDGFGSALATLGDLDHDGTVDLAVGAPGNIDGGVSGSRRGALWILFLRPDGTLKDWRKVSSTSGGFGGELADGDAFGSSLALLGDLDGDGVPDLAVGAPGDDAGGVTSNTGAVWILYLRSDGSVKAQRKLGASAGGPSGLDDGDGFGSSLAKLGDLDGDGLLELAIGASGDDDGGLDRGAIWVLALKRDGSTRTRTKISANQGGFGGALAQAGGFGGALAALGDLDGDKVGDLAAGVAYDDDGGTTAASDRGAIWVLFLAPDGSVRAESKISAARGRFDGVLETGDSFGAALAATGDLDGDGVVDLASGAPGDEDGGRNHGALWLLRLDGVPAR